MAYNLKSIKQKFRENGVFYTPPELVAQLYAYAPKTYINVYDPTCGDGALLAGAKDGANLYGQEIDAKQARQARENMPRAHIAIGDTLESPAFMDLKFDLVIGNYPFSIKWNPEGKDKDPRFCDLPCLPTKSKADFAFIAHSLHMLSNDGKCILLCSPGVGYRGQREGKIRQYIVDKNWVERVVHIPGDTFADTKISTLLIVFNKSKNTTDIIFEDKEQEKTRTVKLEEVKAHEYNLSVNTYIEKEIKNSIKDTDPFELNKDIRQATMDGLKHSLQFDKNLITIDKEMTLDSHIAYVKALIKILQEHLEDVEKEVA